MPGTAPPRPAPKAVTIGLQTTQQCSDASSLAGIIGALVLDRFALSATKTKGLENDLVTYFCHAGINDEIFSFIKDPSSWPDYPKMGKKSTSNRE